jgi:hypothetical protein
MNVGYGGKLVAFFSRSSIATWVSFIAKSLPLFLLPTFLFSSFTADEVAFWFILITLQGMQLLLAVGTMMPVIRGFAYALGGATQVRDMRNATQQADSAPNMDLMGRIWSASSIAHVLIGVTTLLLLGAMGVWSAASLIAELPGQRGLWGALAVFVVGGALRAYGGQHMSYLMGVNRIALVRWWEAGFWLLAFATALGAVLAGGGLLEISLAYQTPLFLNILWNAWLCRQDQARRPGFQRVLRLDIEILTQMWPAIWKTGLGTVIGALVMPAAILSYTRVLSAQDTTALLYFLSIIRPLGQFAQVPFMVTLPRLARMQAQADIEGQRKIVESAMSLTYVLHGVTTFAFGLFLYVKYPDTLFSYASIWFLFGIAGLLERISGMHTQWYATTNHVVFHWLNTAAAGIFIISLIVFLKWFLVPAFLAAQITYLCIFYLPVAIIMSRKQFNAKFRPEFFVAAPLVALLFTVALLTK